MSTSLSGQVIITRPHQSSWGGGSGGGPQVLGASVPATAAGCALDVIGPNSHLTVQLLDGSRMDAPSKTLSQYEVKTGPNDHLKFPIPFKLFFDPLQFHNRSLISVAARITDTSSFKKRIGAEDGEEEQEEEQEGDLLWISTTTHSVLTLGNPSDDIDVEVERVQNHAEEPNQVEEKEKQEEEGKEGKECPEPLMQRISGRISAESSEGINSIGAGNRIVIQLLDVSLMDAPSVTIAETVMSTGSGVSFPIEFWIEFDKTRIEERNTYSVSVRVEELGTDQLVWISTYANNVLTRGEPDDGVQITVEHISP